jgi:hypothetical protein
MADETRNRDMARGQEGEVREARPENAAQDPQAAARQAEAQRNTDELRESARRVEASTPPEARDRTVQEMTRDAERNADRSRG